jgi:predicted nucleic acid-binding protein
MKRLVVDASVAVKWYIPEIHGEAAVRFLDPAFDLSAPELIGPEFGNILWKKIRRSEITPEEGSEILSAFQALDLQLYPTSSLLASAMELAVALDHSVYDSLYLALAIALERRLVTADRRFHTVIAQSAFSNHVLWVEGTI